MEEEDDDDDDPQISNFMKIHPVGSQVVPCGWLYRQVDGRTDRQMDIHDEANSHAEHV
jgi:major membrane immunogen (membrane-anchored lipoprotein)